MKKEKAAYGTGIYLHMSPEVLRRGRGEAMMSLWRWYAFVSPPAASPHGLVFTVQPLSWNGCIFRLLSGELQQLTAARSPSDDGNRFELPWPLPSMPTIVVLMLVSRGIYVLLQPSICLQNPVCSALACRRLGRVGKASLIVLFNDSSYLYVEP